MNTPTAAELNKIRKEGFRTNVVCCYISAKSVLFTYTKKYKLWAIPQGGIENDETPEDAIKRETLEELGEEFYDKCDKNFELFGYDKMEFLPDKYNLKELKDDKGNDITMIGKAYFFYAIKVDRHAVDLAKSAFDEADFLEFEQAIFLADKIYQQGKRRLTLNILQTLRKLNTI